MRTAFAAPLFLTVLALAASPAQAGARGFTGDRPVTLRDYLPHPMDTEGYSEQWHFAHETGEGRYLNFQMELTNTGVGDAKGRMKIRFKGPDGKKIHKSKRCKVRGRIDEGQAVLSCGGLVIRSDLDGYTAEYKTRKLEMKARVRASVPPWRPGDGRVRLNKKGDDFYDILLTVPRGRLEATVLAEGTSHRVAGIAYATHSFSSVSPDEVAKNWIRFKRLDEQSSLVFATLRTPSGARMGYAMIADEQGRMLASASPRIELKQGFPAPNRKKYKVPAEIVIAAAEGQDALAVHVLGGYIRKVKDPLKGLSSVERFVAQRFSDPFGYSMSGVFRVRWERQGAEPLEFEDDGGYLVEHINP